MMNKGKGEPWQIMYANVVKRLERCRGLHQLPLTIDEVGAPCFPDPEERGPKRWRWENLQRTLNFAGSVTFVVNDDTFWMANQTDTTYPTPVMRTRGVVIDKEHPHYDTIVKWIEAAGAIDQEIEDGKMYVNRTMRLMKHPKWVEEYWPDIVPYVGSVPEAMIRGLREPRPSALNLDKALQVRIVELLTLASLLQEDDLHAWVGAPP